MEISLVRVRLLAAEVERRGSESAAALVRELVDFTELEATHAVDLPKDKNVHRKKSCTGKERLDKGQAVQQSMELNRGLPAWMDHYTAYPCLYCGCWHTGRDKAFLRRYRVGVPMTDMGQSYSRVWLEVQKPEWLVEDQQARAGMLGSLLKMLFEEFGWEIPGKPGRCQKMIEIFKASFVEPTGESHVEEAA